MAKLNSYQLETELDVVHKRDGISGRLHFLVFTCSTVLERSTELAFLFADVALP